MRASRRSPKLSVRLNCESLEDRTTPTAAFGLSGSTLLAFDTVTPSASTSTAIVGVHANESLVGIDLRELDGALYSLGVNAIANTATLYSISTATGIATAVGATGAIAFVDTVGNPVDLPDPTAIGYGFDIDPTTDRVRVVTGNGLNFRVDPLSGAPVDGNTGLPGTVNGINTDGVINGLPSGSTGVSATAYTNNPLGGATTQYTLDSGSNSLFIQTTSNSGTQTTQVNLLQNGVPLDFTSANGFDISNNVRVTTSGTVANGFGIAALTVNNVARIYQIDLATGAATELGAAPRPLTGLALSLAPASVIAFTNATFTETETNTNAAITLTRTGDISSAVTVAVTATGGTATAGLDYSGTSHVVSFAPGQDTATLNIAITNDSIAEGNETITFTLSAPSVGAELGTQVSATLNISDISAPTAPSSRKLVTLGSAAGGGAVQVLNADNTVRFSFPPYGESMLAGVRVASGDVTGDGVDDIITAPSTGVSHVKVFDGVTGSEVRSFLAFDRGFLGGVTLAADDIDGDGIDDIIVGTATGFSHVKAFSGANGSEMASFIAYEGFLGGITVASGDVNNDGRTDIVTGSALGVGHVKAFSGGSFTLLQSFFAYRPFGGGVSVATGDVDNDGFDDIIAGTARGGSHVKVFSGKTGELVRSFVTFPPAYSGGVNVTSGDANGDNIADIFVSGAKGAPHIKVYDGTTATLIDNFFASSASFSGGVFIN